VGERVGCGSSPGSAASDNAPIGAFPERHRGSSNPNPSLHLFSGTGQARRGPSPSDAARPSPQPSWQAAAGLTQGYLTSYQSASSRHCRIRPASCQAGSGSAGLGGRDVKERLPGGFDAAGELQTPQRWPRTTSPEFRIRYAIGRIFRDALGDVGCARRRDRELCLMLGFRRVQGWLTSWGQ
jgi:hypothetical protein